MVNIINQETHSRVTYDNSETFIDFCDTHQDAIITAIQKFSHVMPSDMMRGMSRFDSALLFEYCLENQIGKLGDFNFIESDSEPYDLTHNDVRVSVKTVKDLFQRRKLKQDDLIKPKKLIVKKSKGERKSQHKDFDFIFVAQRETLDHRAGFAVASYETIEPVLRYLTDGQVQLDMYNDLWDYYVVADEYSIVANLPNEAERNYFYAQCKRELMRSVAEYRI